MFWVIEESQRDIWCPKYIIFCFQLNFGRFQVWFWGFVDYRRGEMFKKFKIRNLGPSVMKLFQTKIDEKYGEIRVLL